MHEASRIADIATGGEILASVSTVSEDVPTSAPRSIMLKGFSEPIDVVAIDWK